MFRLTSFDPVLNDFVLSNITCHNTALSKPVNISNPLSLCQCALVLWPHTHMITIHISFICEQMFLIRGRSNVHHVFIYKKIMKTLQRRRRERDGVSNHQPHDCSLNRLFRRRSNKPSKLRVTCLFEGNSSVNSPHKDQVTRKMVPVDDVIIGYTIAVLQHYWKSKSKYNQMVCLQYFLWEPQVGSLWWRSWLSLVFA